MSKKHIVIIGSGFGGIYTFLHLKKLFKGSSAVKITIVSKTNHFLFTPLLHEAATGLIDWLNAVEPVRDIIKNSPADFIEAEVEAIYLNKKVIKTNSSDIHYDYLVIATGASTNYYSVPGAKDYAFALYNLHDSIKLRSHLMSIFEKAHKAKNKQVKKELLSIAVIGGGPTGVKVSAELHELFEDTFKHYYPNSDLKDFSITIVDASTTILPQLSTKLQKKAFNKLKNKGIKFKLNSCVKKINKNKIIFENGDEMVSSTVIWVAGVKPNVPEFYPSIDLDKSNRICVNDYLQVENFDNVFAIGDVAGFKNNSETCLPMLAQVAYRQGQTCAENIYKTIFSYPLKKFIYKSQGTLLALGKSDAVGDVYGIPVNGYLGAILEMGVYFLRSVSLRNKAKLAVDWVFGLFYPRDISSP